MCRDNILEQGRELCEYGCIWEAVKLHLSIIRVGNCDIFTPTVRY